MTLATLATNGATAVQQLWTVVSQGHNRLTKLMWCAGWTVPLVALGLIISIPFWRAVIADVELTVTQQVEYEDGSLCRKFGFATGSERFNGCMLDLLDLRRSHQRLVAAASLP